MLPSKLQSVLLEEHEGRWEWVPSRVEREAAICMGYPSCSEDIDSAGICWQPRKWAAHVVVPARLGDCFQTSFQISADSQLRPIAMLTASKPT